MKELLHLRLKFIGPLFALAAVITSCSSDDDDDDSGNWVEKSVFDGVPRSNSAAFTIGSTGYMGTGYDGDDYLKDFWAYHMGGDYWEQLPEFPGEARSAAVGFAIDGAGYIGLGYNGDTNKELGDCYRFDTSANAWTQVADFGGTARRAAVAFSSDSYGYVGTGYDGQNDKKDFWKYDPANDTWEELVGFGGTKRRDATSFRIANKVYMGSGVSNGLNQDDFWVFDLDAESWTALNDLDEEDTYELVRNNAVGFSLNGKGYLALGVYSSSSTSSVWEYDPSDDTWEEKTSFEGVSRQGSVAFYNDEMAFIALGRSGTLYLDDTYQFFPNEEYNEDD
ncbi:Kelch repeat-containing protein [Robertkochia solimangrovi]|uniref:Kelch repeat-containing protein n=1 Tax=Robertkochia solimangrovi TaxID=2213046 RepID=UPI00117F0043|nr:galactose oxidase [Robertkochia solimangrovi]TRZ41867.1 galactose oxidase [Robertkochia solimangrovi]